MTNVNPTTGIRYGTIYGNEAPTLMEAIFERGVNKSWEAYRSENLATIKRLLSDTEDDALTRLAVFIGVMSNEDDPDGTAAEYIENQDGEPATDADAQSVFDSLELGESFQCDEPSYSYTDSDGNQFEMSSLGGAQLIFCIKTNKVVYVNRLCSPCVPNAGDLSSGIVENDGGHHPEGLRCYGVPDEYATN